MTTGEMPYIFLLVSLAWNFRNILIDSDRKLHGETLLSFVSELVSELAIYEIY